jgi:hypothetical protein
MANWLVMTAAIRVSMPTLAPFVGTYDPGVVHYFGASEGHILGGTLAALNPDFSRIVLNVGGAGLSHMMFRSQAFQSLLAAIAIKQRDSLNQRKLAATMQPLLDRIDPATYAPHVLGDKLPGSPADRRICMQTGIGDITVPNLAAFMHARHLGLAEIVPTAQTIFGVQPVSAPALSSAITVFDFGIDPHVYELPSPPIDKDPVHEALRVRGTALAQMNQFYADGTIINPCGGPCSAK